MTLYHITSAEEARAAAQTSIYKPKEFDKEGFVHCSYRRQVVATANRIFRGRSGLVLLEIDRARLGCPVVDENLEGGTELFPHIYGPIPMTAVVEVHQLPCDQAGEFHLPAVVRAPR